MEKLPKKISEIIKEAPYSYSFLAVSEYLNKRVGANELHRRWKIDKKLYLK